MQELSKLVTKCIAELGGDVSGYATIAKNNIAYKAAIKKIWKEREAVNLILSHTNAFYIREDKSPRKGPDKDKPYMICDIVLDDGLVRSEIDTHRELLAAHLLTSGLKFEEINIIAAKGNMRDRHPFATH